MPIGADICSWPQTDVCYARESEALPVCGGRSLWIARWSAKLAFTEELRLADAQVEQAYVFVPGVPSATLGRWPT